jgi:menaquinone-specific isochorismate synthase
MTPTALIPEREPTRLSARTRAVDDNAELLSLLPNPNEAFSWVRQGEGVVGWGEAARIETSGPDRYSRAEEEWRRLAERVAVADDVGLPGCGLIAFASFAFGDRPGHSVLIVPRVVVGRKAGKSWITEIDGEGVDALEAVSPIAAPGSVRWHEGIVSEHRWWKSVAEAVRRMRASSLDKVVLARDLIAEADGPIDPRFLLRRLAENHPDCWTFGVDGLVGATPELLLRRHGSEVCSRVLAGSTWPGAEGSVPLLRSTAHREEHRFAVDSLVASLSPYCATIHADCPTVLELRNIAHLSTDVSGTLAGQVPASLFELAEAVHPTAAVGGTPRDEAVHLIAELEQHEGLDRGRYAAPVGWVDANGNGELGIALRCAQLSGARAHLFAGCGLIADSDPDVEVAESRAKFAAVRDALGD